LSFPADRAGCIVATHDIDTVHLIWGDALSEPAKAMTIYVDADACPVKAEIYRVVERYVIKVYVVDNSTIAVPSAVD
jgi:hypothetical protein